MGNDKKRLRIFLLLMMDIILINIAYMVSFYIRLGSIYNEVYNDIYVTYLPLILISYIGMLAIFKMYRSIWRIAGIDEVIQGVSACIIAGVINFVILEFMPFRIPRVVTVLSCFFIIAFVLGVRLSYRFIRRISVYGNVYWGNGEKVLIYGAGACGSLLIEEIRKAKDNKYKIIGLIDDNPNKEKKYIKGIKVIGDRSKIAETVKDNKVKTIFFAMPSLDAKEKSEILDICKETKAKVKIVPSFYETIDDQIDLKQVRDVDLRDLLGREEIVLDKEGISEYLNNKVILITGGGGTIGSELCRQIVLFKPKKIVLLDIYENNVYDLQNELSRNHPELDKEVIIASVRDRNKIDQVFNEYRPDVVFHAAAHKHVPLMEYNPTEAIKNNVRGTLNVAECADKYNCDKFVLISTDKAVNPTNVMGATKRFCEMIVQALNERSKTDFVAVRFGNVLGSNGSVIPLFKKQISEGGPVTLTHPDIIRYFMLIPEAAQLVLQAGAYAKGGEIFILDMGKPVKIYDLAVNLIKLSGFEPGKDIEIKVTGLRPGEKLYEELLMDEEGLTETKHKKIFIGKPSSFDLDTIKAEIDEIMKVAEGGNKVMLRQKLHEIVPTYNPQQDLEVAATDNKE
ncbi:polysaccharide biosynthesis protein [Clostridium sp. NSJ-6]|uniref:Polysaccharide biosynthesis protein n=1 Tax=Clostridium hominis TaxID=2763036 RepID=A0ABR7D9H8_9CLOT|nr:nucleoside-diphosphate sugar epimerase/dehydratase [Clostridium hominis]MBC5628045.1 polysaccharide biosynthesis protein [Clostridium hominis]MDU2673192.1 nucleoside-diphosphate sugar epimerase/dehydratase [Clostridium sp.]